VRRPYEGGRSVDATTPRCVCTGTTRHGCGQAKRRSIDTLGRRLVRDGLPPERSAREEIGRNPGQDLRRSPWKGKKPGVTGEVAVLKTLVASKDFCRAEAQEPRLAKPVRRDSRWKQWQDETVSGSIRAATHRKPGRSRTPKGKPHERCRYERKPVRARRAKTTKRVAKP